MRLCLPRAGGPGVRTTAVGCGGRPRGIAPGSAALKDNGADMTRDEALQLMHEHTLSPSLRQHMLAVEAAMRAYASKSGADPETWGIVGLLHDFDYEKFPNSEHSPTEGHPAWGVRLLRERGLPDALCRAILGHATYSGVPRDTRLAQTLFAVDELCGFLVACALVRPSRSFADLEVSSVKKKLKDKAFARGRGCRSACCTTRSARSARRAATGAGWRRRGPRCARSTRLSRGIRCSSFSATTANCWSPTASKRWSAGCASATNGQAIQRGGAAPGATRWSTCVAPRPPR